MSTSRPSSSGVNKRSSSSSALGVINNNTKNITTANLYGFNIPVNNAAGVNGKSYAGRPSSAGHSRGSGQQNHTGHILGQSISNRIATVNNTAAIPLNSNINVLFPQASSGSGATYARPKSAGTIDIYEN